MSWSLKANTDHYTIQKPNPSQISRFEYNKQSSVNKVHVTESKIIHKKVKVHMW